MPRWLYLAIAYLCLGLGFIGFRLLGLGDKLDRQIQKHKQKLQDHHRGEKMNHAEAE